MPAWLRTPPTFTAVFPPRQASTWASSVVGARTSPTPRIQVDAAKAPMSSTMPPPTARTMSFLDTPTLCSSDHRAWRVLGVLSFSEDSITKAPSSLSPTPRSTAWEWRLITRASATRNTLRLPQSRQKPRRSLAETTRVSLPTLQPRRRISRSISGTPDEPDERGAEDDRDESEGQPDARESREGDGIAGLPQHRDGHDVRRRADR